MLSRSMALCRLTLSKPGESGHPLGCLEFNTIVAVFVTLRSCLGSGAVQGEALR